MNDSSNALPALESRSIYEIPLDLVNRFKLARKSYTGPRLSFQAYWESQVCKLEQQPFGYGQMCAAEQHYLNQNDIHQGRVRD